MRLVARPFRLRFARRKTKPSTGRLVIKKEGLGAPLLFLALAIAAYGSANAMTTLWLLSLVLLWLGARCIPSSPRPAGMSWVGLSACLLGAWIVLNNFFASPAYTAAAPFHAAFLVGGFLLGRRAGAAAASRLFSVALAFAVAMALWALWQWWTAAANRAHAVFITPATLGAATNLVLVPALVLYVLLERQRFLLACIVVLAATLSVAQSRGAWLALAAAFGGALVLARRGGLAEGRIQPRLAIVVALLIAAFSASWLIGTTAGSASGTPMPLQATASLTHRFELYQLALGELAHSSWLVGSGYQSFYYVLEAARPTIPEYAASSTYFVHNDYLQMLLELGVPGLLALLGVALLPLSNAWRAVADPTLPARSRILLAALAGGTASMAVHALGDFPFYIPACILIYGVALGLIETQVHAPRTLQPGPARRVAVTAIVTLAAWFLVVPAAAEAASEYGLRSWQSGRGTEAAWGFETARRIDPRDWRYHWYAGQFWMAQAASRSDRSAAALADKALARGVAENPREVRPLLDRMALHSRFRHLLAEPVPETQVVAWARRALELAPADDNVRAEHDRVLRRFAGAEPRR